jgi:hypothetical protein
MDMTRYSPGQRGIIIQFMYKLAVATRKTGKISETTKAKILDSFGQFDEDIVIDALSIYIHMDIAPAVRGRGKNEKYVRGIMANRQAEKDRRGGGTHGAAGNIAGTTKASSINAATHRDEGERLRRLAESIGEPSIDTDCDF